MVINGCDTGLCDRFSDGCFCVCGLAISFDVFVFCLCHRRFFSFIDGPLDRLVEALSFFISIRN